MSNEIKIENLKFGYGYRSKKIFNGLNVSIALGQIVGIVGRNGEGKTTLMKLIAGKLRPDEGTVSIDGKDPSTDIELANKIIYVASTYDIESYSKLKDIIQCYKLMYKNFDINFANKLMDVFDLGQNKRIGRLSKGQTTIFEFICAIASRAEITILDEPVSGADSVRRKQIYDIILRDYIEYPRTILISSHLLSEMENILSNICMIGAGQILYNGDVDEMKHKAFKVKGTRQQVTEFIKDRKVIFKQLCETNNMAVVEEDLSKAVMDDIKDKGLIAERLSAEEFYMYRTTVNLGEDLEKLWEK